MSDAHLFPVWPEFYPTRKRRTDGWANNLARKKRRIIWRTVYVIRLIRSNAADLRKTTQSENVQIELQLRIHCFASCLDSVILLVPLSLLIRSSLCFLYYVASFCSFVALSMIYEYCAWDARTWFVARCCSFAGHLKRERKKQLTLCKSFSCMFNFRVRMFLKMLRFAHMNETAASIH